MFDAKIKRNLSSVDNSSLPPIKEYCQYRLSGPVNSELLPGNHEGHVVEVSDPSPRIPQRRWSHDPFPTVVETNCVSMKEFVLFEFFYWYLNVTSRDIRRVWILSSYILFICTFVVLCRRFSKSLVTKKDVLRFNWINRHLLIFPLVNMVPLCAREPWYWWSCRKYNVVSLTKVSSLLTVRWRVYCLLKTTRKNMFYNSVVRTYMSDSWLILFTYNHFTLKTEIFCNNWRDPDF